MSTEDYSNCPVGIANRKEIEKTEDKFAMAIQRIEEKLSDLKEDVTTGFSDINKKLDKVDDRFNGLEANIPNMIDDRIKQNTSNKIISVVKWIVVSLCGSLTITLVTRLILQVTKLD